MRRVLVTGAAGYIGSVLVRQLLERGHEVYGIDRLLFGSHGLRGLQGEPRFHFRYADVRRPSDYRDLLLRVDSVVHLAAIVGEPACSQQPELARATNRDASLKLYSEAILSPSVERFIFASTCSNYGRHPEIEYCTEDSPLRPLSLYAETKVEVERHILASDTGRTLIPTCLRFATAYGLSPRMRFDLTVNEFTRDVFADRRLEIYGQQFWRPYCHTLDIARSCATVLEADGDLVDHRVFNVGSTEENYTKTHLAAMLRQHRPGADIVFVHREEDPRDYKVRCDRIREVLGFETTRTVSEGVREIFAALSEDAFDPYQEQTLRDARAA